jgi:hypothetical protein
MDLLSLPEELVAAFLERLSLRERFLSFAFV